MNEQNEQSEATKYAVIKQGANDDGSKWRIRYFEPFRVAPYTPANWDVATKLAMDQNTFAMWDFFESWDTDGYLPADFFDGRGNVVASEFCVVWVEGSLIRWANIVTESV